MSAATPRDPKFGADESEVRSEVRHHRDRPIGRPDGRAGVLSHPERVKLHPGDRVCSDCPHPEDVPDLDLAPDAPHVGTPPEHLPGEMSQAREAAIATTRFLTFAVMSNPSTSSIPPMRTGR